MLLKRHIHLLLHPFLGHIQSWQVQIGSIQIGGYYGCQGEKWDVLISHCSLLYDTRAFNASPILLIHFISAASKQGKCKWLCIRSSPHLLRYFKTSAHKHEKNMYAHASTVPLSCTQFNKIGSLTSLWIKNMEECFLPNLLLIQQKPHAIFPATFPAKVDTKQSTVSLSCSLAIM